MRRETQKGKSFEYLNKLVVVSLLCLTREDMVRYTIPNPYVSIYSIPKTRIRQVSSIILSTCLFFDKVCQGFIEITR